MSDRITLTAELREDAGKGASRRLRRLQARIPAIVYGGNTDPRPISLEHRELDKALENEAFYSQVIELDIAGTRENVILKDLQRHPSRPLLMHADFMRVRMDQEIQVAVPLHFINEERCVGVKQGGGLITHTLTEVEVEGLPGDIPEFIEVDMAAIELGQHIHLSDLKLPAGITSVELSHGEDHDLQVAAVLAPKGGVAEDDAAEEAPEGDGE
ncbi:MAG: 50S ribosomal protein L25/general stress protein Ctc [Pseudomonadota bacterium]|nr:50S ribosomal protein L25/general stress protein Ctc [Pseudomonadota bacterium]